MAKHDDGQLGMAAALVRSAFLVNAVYAESGREYGLTPQQGQLLCVLMAQPYGMSELGAMLGLAKSSLTGLVDRTERNGLVSREPDPQDTRAVRVALTPQGSKLAEQFYGETCRRIEKLPAGLSAAECGTLVDLLSRVVFDNKVPAVFLEQDEGPPRS
jgi:DNA-binding MarR family transcriptional regulator